MVEAARGEAWHHTAYIVCMLANVNRDPKKRPRPFTPEEFNPLAPGKGGHSGNGVIAVSDANGAAMMRAAFMGKKI